MEFSKDFPTLTLSEIEKFLTLTRKKGAMAISVIGRLNKYFNQVFETEAGQEILKMDVDRVEELLLKIAEETATDQEKAEFRYIKNVRIPVLIDKLRLYLEKVGQIKKVVTNG